MRSENAYRKLSCEAKMVLIFKKNHSKSCRTILKVAVILLKRYSFEDTIPSPNIVKTVSPQVLQIFAITFQNYRLRQILAFYFSKVLLYEPLRAYWCIYYLPLMLHNFSNCLCGQLSALCQTPWLPRSWIRCTSFVPTSGRIRSVATKVIVLFLFIRTY